MYGLVFGARAVRDAPVPWVLVAGRAETEPI